MVPTNVNRSAPVQGRPMLKPLFATLLAVMFSMPGCGKTETPRATMAPKGPRIGQPVPDVVATDLDGLPLKLSDHQGKIVALSFWANWCPPCRSLFPHERALVEKFQGLQFVLLGVNGDEEREEGKAAQDRNKLNWRSFWNGGREGPITNQWMIEGWPTTFIMDAKGVLRYRFIGAQPQAVEHAIESLLREMDAGKKS